MQCECCDEIIEVKQGYYINNGPYEGCWACCQGCRDDLEEND